jgi:hypothetical protein
MFPAAAINGSMGKFLDRVHTLLGDSLNVFVTWARIFSVGWFYSRNAFPAAGFLGRPLFCLLISFPDQV